MREITQKVYSFNELSPEAKKAALERLAAQVDHIEICTDALASARALADVLNYRIDDYCLGPWTQCYITARCADGDNRADAVSGVRAATWLYNRLKGVLYERPWRGVYRASIPAPLKSHRLLKQTTPTSGPYKGVWTASKLGAFPVESDCPLTGVCYDDTLLRPIRAFIAKPDGRTAAQVIDAAFQELADCCGNECEYREGEEFLSSEADDLDMEFYENGTAF